MRWLVAALLVVGSCGLDNFLWVGLGACPNRTAPMTQRTIADCATACFLNSSCMGFDYSPVGPTCYSQTLSFPRSVVLDSLGTSCFTKYIPGEIDILVDPYQETHEIYNSDLYNSWIQSLGDRDQPSLVPSYWQDSTFVYLQGTIEGGVPGLLFVLPYGFRPPTNVSIVITTAPLDEFLYVSLLDPSLRWLTPFEGRPDIGTNWGRDKTLLWCQQKCTSLNPNCKGLFWGSNFAWGGTNVCITLNTLISTAAGGVVGYSFTKQTDMTSTALLTINPNGSVYVGPLPGISTLSLRGRFPYYRTTTCSATNTYDSTGEMIYQEYDRVRPIHYFCEDVDTSAGTFVSVPTSPGVSVLSGFSPLQSFFDVKTGYVHLRGGLNLSCCPSPVSGPNGTTHCKQTFCLITSSLPTPAWAPYMVSARYPQYEPYTGTGLQQYGRYIVVYQNGTMMVSAGLGTTINLDGIVLTTIAEENGLTYHIGAAVNFTTATTFWSLDTNSSPLRVVTDLNGVVCLSGGLRFDSMSVDEVILIKLDSLWQRNFTTKHPVICEFNLISPDQGSRACAVTVEGSGLVRVHMTPPVNSTVIAATNHRLFVDGVCFGGYKVPEEVQLIGQSQAVLTGAASITLE